MGRHSKPLTKAQRFWLDIQYYVAMLGFAIVMGFTFALALD